jgi:lipopolysaccharide assembly outer membrane protein LptD (OstA)
LNVVLKKLLIGGICFAAGVVAVAAGFDIDFKEKPTLRDLRNVKADSWSIVGKNIIVKGNVFIPYRNITIYADQAVVNIESKDLEASGNIRVYRTRKKSATVTPEELQLIRDLPESLVEIKDYTIDPLGVQRINVMVYSRGDKMQASRVTGNLSSGMLSFNDLVVRYKTFICKAKSGIRKPGGEIVVKKAEISSCNYVLNDNGHYSIFCEEAKIYPHQMDGFGFSGYNPDPGEHSVWGSNCWLKVYGCPVLWLPMFYKPKDESPGLFKVRAGQTSDWGYFISFSKRFDLTDSPYSTIKLMADYYNMRGLGYGADMEVSTEYSKTRIAGYSIYDIRPYYSQDIENSSRLDIPHYRYDFKISNVSHITPRLDFRGHFEVLSDMYFLNDFFRDEFNNNPQPVTFGALEYQFDRFSTALYVRARTNTFFTTVERLPEFRIDIPRQELFSNIYYQGETSIANLQMKWREFDKPRTAGNGVDPKNYSSVRFDTLHMFYYPLKIAFLNIIPRAGFRMTAYSKSSKRKISQTDLENMFLVDQPEGNYNANIVNYDDDGGSKFRVVGEFGVEANTKIYRSWQNVRSAYWGLDGLRHIVEPYMNYTYIPEPTVERDELYYFDDIDRIDKQNFVRIGIRHRLQTRRGSFGNEKIYNWFTMENYWDYHFIRTDGFNNIGDFCTKFSFNPSERVSINTLFSIDAGNNNAHDTQAVRSGRLAGRPGLDLSWLNRWEIALKYKIIEDITMNLAYVYQDPYRSQSAYSMGSTLTELESGSSFDKAYFDRIQNIRFGINFPITPDRTARGAYEIYYDFEAGFIREQRVKIVKTLHCWEVALELSQTRQKDSDNDIEYKHSAMITLYLTGLTTPLERVQRSAVNGITNLRQEGI